MSTWEVLRLSASGDVDFDGMGISEEAQSVFATAMGRYIMDGAYGFWLEPEAGDGHCDPDRLVITLGQRLGALGDLHNICAPGSPIEARMGAALLWLDVDWAGMPAVDYLGGPRARLDDIGPTDALEYFITPQARINAYRADFLVWFAIGRHSGGVIVECDGHDFHERTKEQAARDKRRDRELLSAGYPVMRFTGSEIYKDAIGCAEQVREHLRSVLSRVSRDGGLTP